MTVEEILDRYARQLLIAVSYELRTSIGEIGISEASNEAAALINQLIQERVKDELEEVAFHFTATPHEEAVVSWVDNHLKELSKDLK